MKIHVEPSVDRLRQLSGQYAYLPVFTSCYVDTETPITVFKRFEEDSPNCFLLESAEGGERWGRYSFLASNPLAILRTENGKTRAYFRNGAIEFLEAEPLEAVKGFMNRFSSPALPELPRFFGGAVGFISYDLVRHMEHLPHPPSDVLNTPELCMMVADEVLIFDHVKHKLTFVVCFPSEEPLEQAYSQAIQRLENLYDKALAPASREIHQLADVKNPEITCSVTREQYLESVKIAKQHIFDGDIFQVQISQRFSMEAPSSAFNVYRRLRLTNPSPYMFYIKFEDMTLIGASPELLLRCSDGRLETCPLAGTRRRGHNAEEDAALEQELLTDEKEKSEHMMLVDLGRNDLGRVSEFGSVQVERLMEVVRFSRVMHLSSTVTGKLKASLHPLDALAAVFPAGTLTGAPKVRAMEIIDALETTRRGPYGGAIGYLSFDGHFDSCITIRTVLIKDGKAHVQAAAGIVADSDPEKEYKECQNKARAVLDALREAVNVQ